MVDVVEIGRVFISRPEYLASAREMFVFLAVVFWVFTYGMSYISGRIERQLGVGQR
jgi:general L-amino acid transport system permease protein